MKVKNKTKKQNVSTENMEETEGVFMFIFIHFIYPIIIKSWKDPENITMQRANWTENLH